DGYRAYSQHNWTAAMSDLRAAAESYPQLGDYALYYLARSAVEAGDLSTANTAANRLIETYPQSVMAQRARLLLADIAMKQGHPEQARVSAARDVESSVEGDTEREARLKLAQAFVARGQAGGAY